MKIPDFRSEEERRRHYIRLTACMIARRVSYTEKLVEGWPTEKIIRRLQEATRRTRSPIPPDVRWWAARKRELTND